MDGRSTSAKKLLGLWAFCFALTLFWGFADLHQNPGLAGDGEVSLRPNLSQVADLAHWGGRLVGNGRVGLFLANAALISGVAAVGSVLLVDFVEDLIRRRRRRQRKSDQAVPPDGE